MNLYEFEGKHVFEQYGISTPKGGVVLRDDCGMCSGQEISEAYTQAGSSSVVVKAQVLSGKRGKNNGIIFCDTLEETAAAVEKLFQQEICGQYVAAVRIEEKLNIAEEHYLSVTYDTNKKQPIVVYSAKGGVDIEEVAEEHIKTVHVPIDQKPQMENIPFLQELWEAFIAEDCRVAEINPLVKTADGSWIAADAKVALDDDAFYRHTKAAVEKESTIGRIDWEEEFEPRTMLGRPPTEREIAVEDIDKGEKYYQGTAGKYIEMDGDIAILFSGGGASIANMDALLQQGLSAANYTEYSGNPPREKVSALAKIVLSKPGLKGLWIAGGVANFTNVRDTFQGIVDALDELKPTYPIVVRRAGPYEEEGMQLMRECAERNNLNMQLFGKEMSMSESAKVLAEAVQS